MSPKVPKVFPVFEMTIVIALALIGWAAFRLYEIVPEVDRERSRLEDLKAEYFQIADYLGSSITELNVCLTNYLQGREPAEIEQFQRKGQELRQWLETKKRRWSAIEAENSARAAAANAPAPSVKIKSQLLPLLAQVDQSSTNYLRAARYLMANVGRPLLQERLALREQTVHRSSQRMLNQSKRARMLGEALELALAPQRQFGELEDRFQHLRWALLLAIVGLCFLLMLAVYRSKVSQTVAIIEQHKHHDLEQEAMMDKLTHFGRLAQELAHEIKQPLTAINARAYTLQKVLAPGSDEHKDAVVIRNEIKRLDQTVKDFLQLARPAEPKLVALTVDEALRDIKDLMASQLEQESIEFNYECDDHLQIQADPQQLKQVLINLLKNAAECLDHQGSVCLRAKRGTARLNGEETEAALIEVEDTGPGIPHDIQKRIFDPFFSTKGDGTGLGLAIAARIIDKHGGNLEFDTEPGKGTTFRIVLPACPNGQPA
jgi:signal transduction histidine kinase